MRIKASEIEKAVNEQCNGSYAMSLVSGDEGTSAVERCVNQGIDAHLEACFVRERGDSYEWEVSRLYCSVSAESLPVLLRRLTDDEGDGTLLADEWEGPRLATDVLETLGWSGVDTASVKIVSKVDERTP